MPALHLTKSKSVQNLVATGRGVHTCAAGENMFPFTQGDLQESREMRKQSKREPSGEKRRKSKNVKQGSQSW